MMRDRLRAALKHDEGSGPMLSGRLMPYRDCCGRQDGLCRCEHQGKLTIGYGRNIQDRGISLAEADEMLEHDIDAVIRDLVVAFPWFEGLNPVRQAVMVNVCFNIGLTRFRRFHRFLAAAKHGEHETAAVELLDSRYAEQTGRRARRLAEEWRTGEVQPLA